MEPIAVLTLGLIFIIFNLDFIIASSGNVTLGKIGIPIKKFILNKEINIDHFTNHLNCDSSYTRKYEITSSNRIETIIFEKISLFLGSYRTSIGENAVKQYFQILHLYCRIENEQSIIYLILNSRLLITLIFPLLILIGAYLYTFEVNIIPVVLVVTIISLSFLGNSITLQMERIKIAIEKIT